MRRSASTALLALALLSACALVASAAGHKDAEQHALSALGTDASGVALSGAGGVLASIGANAQALPFNRKLLKSKTKHKTKRKTRRRTVRKNKKPTIPLRLRARISKDHSVDDDGDHIPDYKEKDANHNGLADDEEDTDGDNIPDQKDDDDALTKEQEIEIENEIENEHEHQGATPTSGGDDKGGKGGHD